MMDVTAGGSAAWIPVFRNADEEQKEELEDYLDGHIEPERKEGQEGEMMETNRVDPNSKDTDSLEDSLRKAGLKPLR